VVVGESEHANAQHHRSLQRGLSGVGDGRLEETI